MNISEVVTTLKTQNSLYGVTLPFVDEVTKEPIPTENIIAGVLTKVTVPMYSQFVPWKREGDISVQQLKCIDERKGIYMLPAFLTMTPVMYTIDVRLPDTNTRGTFGDIAPAYGIARSVQGVVTGQAYMMLVGLMRHEPTFHDLGYNKIQLLGYPKTVLTFEVACRHLPNLESIEEGCYDSFMQLANLDLQEFLYNSLKKFKTIPSAHGQYEIDISDWQGAAGEKKELLERWRDVYHVDMGWEKWM